jgi:oligopeptide transport system substrate-binding protein
MPQRRALRFFLAVSCALLAACDNNPNPKPLHAKRADGSPWLVRYGSMADEPRSLDPQVSYDSVSRRVLEPVYDCLLEYHPMKTDPYEVVPCLLEKMPERTANADGTVTYLCKLKRGVLFHDDPCFPGGKGREVVAADVHYAWQRMCDPKIECPVFSNLADYVIGLNDAYEAAKKNGGRFDYTMPLRGFEIVDSHTFKIHLLRPYPQLVYWMAMHFTCPVAREAVEFYDGKEHADGAGGKMETRPLFKFHPVGDGPFRIAEYTRGQRVRLERNPHYITTVFPSDGWPPEKEKLLRPLAGHALPIVDEVQLTIFREMIPIWLLMRQGYLDGMGVSKDAFNSVVSPAHELSAKWRARGMSLEKDVEPGTFYMAFNMQDPLLGKNKKLRQALSAAFDAQGWIDIFYNGVPEVAQQLVPPGIFGNQKTYRNPYGFDLKKARALIAEAGYPNGRNPKTGQPLELTMDAVATGADERLMTEYEQRQLEQLGIRVRVIENNFPRMMEKEDQGNFQIASGSGWQADYPDPENFYFLYYSKNVPPAGKNISRYKNAEFDALFDKMATMENSPERLEIAHRMNDILNEDCPHVLNFHRAMYALIQPWSPRTHANMMLEGGVKYGLLDYDLREQKRREWNSKPLWPVGVALAIVAAGIIYAARVNRRRNV